MYCASMHHVHCMTAVDRYYTTLMYYVLHKIIIILHVACSCKNMLRQAVRNLIGAHVLLMFTIQMINGFDSLH